MFGAFPLVDQGVEILKQNHSGKSDLIKSEPGDNLVLNGKLRLIERKTSLLSFVMFFGIVIYWLSIDTGFAGSGYKDKELTDALTGVCFSILSFMCCFISWRYLSQNVIKVDESSANIVSVTVIISVILTVSTPAFFGITKLRKIPTVTDICLMSLLGLIVTFGMFAGLAVLQIIQNKVRLLIQMVMSIVLILYAF